MVITPLTEDYNGIRVVREAELGEKMMVWTQMRQSIERERGSSINIRVILNKEHEKVVTECERAEREKLRSSRHPA